mmetsp:Transcript_22475/g.70791  ORF Transcript_22475/g.70791 Transcript_22475/m.70791 type:complete len:252 (-) Transcript_22475:1522-2277(-)
MVRLRGIAWCWADALVPHLEKVFQRERLVWRIPPERCADLEVDELCKRLSEAIGHRLQKDCTVDFTLLLELQALLMASEATSVCEGSYVVRRHTLGCNEVTLAPIGGLAHVKLLAKAIKLVDGFVALLIGVDLDVVTNGVRRPYSNHAGSLQNVFLHNPIQHFLGLLEQFGSLFADTLVLEDRRIITVGVLPTELVNLKERRPIDVFNDLSYGMLLDAEIAKEIWLGRNLRPIDLWLHFLSLLKGLPLLVH